ncbi:MAG: uracil-DNA glycosylase [Hyphomicrobiaceae bacterium]
MSDEATSAEPCRECPLCPRLVGFREVNRGAYPEWHNAPVATFGAVEAPMLVVGLAPGLKGANRTGRPFTGDYAGDLLYATLLELGLARGTYGASPDDGLELVGCRITNAVRCVPPQNKPMPAEIATCREYLSATVAQMPRLAVIVALGRIAHDSVLTSQALRKAAFPFGHGRRHALGQGLTLFDSYHCSRYNTNTRVLTPGMFRSVLAEARAASGI